RDYFSGLLADVSGLGAEAETRLKSAYGAESGLMRIIDAYARVLSRRGKGDEAKAVVNRWKADNPTQPYLARLAKALEAGDKVAPLASTPAEGLAEVFYMLGALGQGQRDPVTSMIYLQMARYLAPKEEIYTLTLAEFYEQTRQFNRAATLYSEIASDSPYSNRAAIGRAAALDRLDKHDEAISVLRTLLAAHPEDFEAADTLGSILRMKKRWPETVEVYNAALKAIPKLEERHFVLLFGRAIGYERQKMWAKAEPDFLAALDLLPKKPRTPREAAERAQVMNYLAYSWVDNGMNIEKSFDMLREAVSLTPGDGAVVDSLGWAYFRLGKFNDAVRELERAVLLKAGDPTINDHLGDAYFKVGRKREAEFKWRQALELNPEPEDAEKIKLKLEKGYEAVAAKGG
ncbi:MAG: tetratricopeptide repeat protein, partial [Proteobacteria bacterium]|nr:tetratricopeptide repeat protein [Pseudomonadota bacterium]